MRIIQANDLKLFCTFVERNLRTEFKWVRRAYVCVRVYVCKSISVAVGKNVFTCDLYAHIKFLLQGLPKLIVKIYKHYNIGSGDFGAKSWHCRCIHLSAVLISNIGVECCSMFLLIVMLVIFILQVEMAIFILHSTFWVRSFNWRRLCSTLSATYEIHFDATFSLVDLE